MQKKHYVKGTPLVRACECAGNVEVLDQRGTTRRTRDYRAAINAYTSCVELDKKNALALSNRAVCHLRLNMFAEVIADASAAFDLFKRVSRHVLCSCTVSSLPRAQSASCVLMPLTGAQIMLPKNDGMYLSTILLYCGIFINSHTCSIYISHTCSIYIFASDVVVWRLVQAHVCVSNVFCVLHADLSEGSSEPCLHPLVGSSPVPSVDVTFFKACMHENDVVMRLR
jgi:hypothetical protein